MNVGSVYTKYICKKVSRVIFIADMESKESRKRRLSRERQRRKRARMDEKSNQEALHAYYWRMLQLKFSCGTSDKAIIEAHNIIFTMVDDLVALKNEGLLPQSGKVIFEHAKTLVPEIKTDVLEQEDVGGQKHKHTGLAQIPKAILNRNNMIREVSYVPLKALLAHISRIHGDNFFAGGIKAMLSVDGVPESHSGSTTLRVKVTFMLSIFTLYVTCM